MGFTDSPEIVAARLESQISQSESRGRTLVIEAESRLNTRIHELEMKLISSGAFTRRDFEWVMGMLFVFMMFVLLILIASKHHDSDDVKPTPQASQAEVPASQAPSAAGEPR